MISKQQKITLAVLGVAVTAVFGPSVLQQAQQGDDTSAMAPSGPSEEEMAAMMVSVDGPMPVAPMVGGASATGGGSLTSPAAGGTSSGGARQDLGTMLDRLESFGASGRVRSLDEIASEWSAATGQAGVSPSGGVAVLGGPDALGQFLEANPLRATFVFADDAIALIGPHSVRVGSELLDGHVVVAKIEAQRVTLTVRGVPRIVDLPPVRASAAQQSNALAAGGAPDTMNNAAGTAQQGAAPNAPAAITPNVP